MVQTIQRIEDGQGNPSDVALLLDLCDNSLGRAFCALGDGATSPITSSIQLFKDEYLEHIHGRGCPFDPLASTVFGGRGRQRGSGGARMTVQAAKPGSDLERREELVTLTIDDIEVSVPPGTLVIRAAEQVGISIPRFCDHPLLDPIGACRQCLVEVPDGGNGRPIPKPQASCTLPVADAW
jgi:hypothetical protein